MKRKRPKSIRFPVLLIVLGAMVIACGIYLALHGKSFTAEQNNHLFNNTENITLSATCGDESVLAVDRVYFNDKKLICLDQDFIKFLLHLII